MIVNYSKKSISKQKSDEENENDNKKSLFNDRTIYELRKLFDILNMLCIQVKQILENEIYLERKLERLLNFSSLNKKSNNE